MVVRMCGKEVFCGAFALLFLNSSQPVLAQSSVLHYVNGNIEGITVSGGSNYAFRIFLRDNGADPLSQCPYGFSYINVSDDNYVAKTSTLTSSYARGKSVSISYILDANGFCQIGDVES